MFVSCAVSKDRGFQMTFANGWTVSVQWGSFNYCDSRHNTDTDRSATAECAVWDKDKVWKRLSENDDVRGWMNADEVATLIQEVAGYPK